MKTNITQSQQEQLKKYADENCKFIHEGKKYTLIEYTIHENDVDIYIMPEGGEKECWGIESWRMEEFFGWFDALEENQASPKPNATKKEKKPTQKRMVKKPKPVKKVKPTKMAAKKSTPKKARKAPKIIMPTNYTIIDPFLEDMKSQKAFHEKQANKLGKMIEIWESKK